MAFSTYTPLQVYPADGVQVDFTVPDLFYDTDDVRCVVIIDGEEITKTSGVDFSVVVTGRELTPPFRQQGLVRFVVPPADEANVVPFILPASVQDQPFEGRAVTPRQHERVHDRAVQSIAMLLELFNRSYRSTLDTPPGLRTIVAGREGYVPTWDADGNLVEGPSLGDLEFITGIVDEIETLAGIAAEIVAVAADAADIGIVATNAAAIGTVAANIVAVNIVAVNIATVEIVADDIAAVQSAATNMAAIIAAPAAAAAAAQSAADAAASAGSMTPVEEQIHAAASKATPADADELGIADSAASWVLKKLSWADLKATLWAAFGALIAGGTAKTTPVDGDTLPLSDSAAANATKKLTWANLKATLKTYFDTVYPLSTSLGTMSVLAEGTTAEYRANTADRGLSTDQVWAAAAPVTLTDAATIAVDMNTFINAVVTLGGNRTLGNPTNAKAGQSGAILIAQDGTGNRTLAFGSNWKFPFGVDPVLSTAAGASDVLYYYAYSSGFIICSLAKSVA